MSFLAPTPSINIQPINKPPAQIQAKPKKTGVEIQTCAAGLVIPVIYGSARVGGNIILLHDYNSYPYENQEDSGGTITTGYFYEIYLVLAICHGQIPGTYGRIWVNGNEQVSGPNWWAYVEDLVNGSLSQDIFRGVAYFDVHYIQQDDLVLPNMNWEVSGKNIISGLLDANPADVLSDLLQSITYGAGFDSAYIYSPPGGGNFFPTYHDYCLAVNILISLTLDNQRPIAEIMTEIIAATNSAPVWSQGVLNIIPYGDTEITGNGITYSPNMSPLYDLTDDDFIAPEGTPPIIMFKKRQSDIYNSLKLEYLNRDNAYSPDVVIAADLLSINLHGLREASSLTTHFFANGTFARNAAQLALQRMIKIKTQYKFNLGWKYIVLDPMDLVTLTDTTLGLSRQLVRIIEIEEDEEGTLSFTAEEVPFCASAPLYGFQANPGYTPPYNAPAPSTWPPIVFEPPDLLAGDVNSPEIWMLISGPDNWGGCDIYYSNDNAIYTKIGTINGMAIKGWILGNISESATSATVLLDNNQQIISASDLDFLLLNSLMIIDQELCAYGTATLLGPNLYSITISRGAWGSIPVPHANNAQFGIINKLTVKFPYPISSVGSIVYFKFPSWNKYGGGKQSVDGVDPVNYQIQGTALLSPLPNVTNVRTAYIDNNQIIQWDPINDFRRGILYEIRMGSAWGTSIVLGRTSGNSWPYFSDGTYWVSAAWAPNEYNIFPGLGWVYSATPSEIIISGGSIQQNIIGTAAENPWWPGTKSQMTQMGGYLYLDDNGDVLSVSDYLNTADIIFLGTIYSSGSYDQPADHWIQSAFYGKMQAVLTYDFYAEKADNNFLALIDVLATDDILGLNFGQFVTITPQVAYMDINGNWGDWQNFTPGWQMTKGVKARILVSSSYGPGLRVALKNFGMSVTLPDTVFDGLNVLVPFTGLTVQFSSTYNVLKNIQVTILSAENGDWAFIDPALMTTSGFFIQIFNGANPVNKYINWFSSGY
jgi:hypothetical protein